jgi:aspartate racemase
MAAAASATEAQRRYFADQAEKLVAAGAEAIVLGGTDLFLAFEGTTPDYPIIDSALVHADEIARVSMGG